MHYSITKSNVYMKKIIALILLLVPTVIYSQNKIPAKNLQEDAKLLWQAINELHPGTYRHTDIISLQKTYKKLLNDFTTDRTSQEAFIHLSEFIEKIKCGHTYLNPFNQANTIIDSLLSKNVLLPFSFKIVEGKLIIDQSFSGEIVRHDIVKCINDYRVETIVDSLAHYIKTDGNRNQKKIKDLEVSLDNKYNYFDYYFAMIYGLKDSLTIELEDGHIHQVPLVSSDERRSLAQSISNDYDDQWSYTFHKDYAYLKLGTFVTWKMTFDWEEYLDQFFEELKQKHVQSLIIDIRGNEGGLTDVSDYIVDQLATQKGICQPRRQHLAYRKVNKNLRPHLSTWNKWFYNISLWTKKLNGRYRTPRFTRPDKKIKKNNQAFNGQTYLLINESNSSATFFLAENCKLNNYATLIGTETGGTKRGINGGQIFFLKLPNSKITVDIPLIGYYPEVNLQDEGIMPHKTIATTLKDFKLNIDKPLMYTIGLIKNKDEK